MIFTAYNDANFQMTDGGILIKAKPHSDMVVDAQTAAIISNASYLAQDVEGDFTFSALVSHRFLSTYDACCLIAYANDKLWSKACFECTEEGEHAVVTVMTNGLSDDANSVRITGNRSGSGCAGRGTSTQKTSKKVLHGKETFPLHF